MGFVGSGVKQLGVYIMGGMMAISRAELLKELLPGLNELFGLEYKSREEQRIALIVDQIMLDDLKKAEELKDGIQEQS
jgi:hypothetical protein